MVKSHPTDTEQRLLRDDCAVSVHGHQMEADHLIFNDCQTEAPADLVANGSPVNHIYLTYLIFHAGHSVKISVHSCHICLNDHLVRSFTQ